jgi:hypothetical protein
MFIAKPQAVLLSLPTTHYPRSTFFSLYHEIGRRIKLRGGNFILTRISYDTEKSFDSVFRRTDIPVCPEIP